MDLVLCFLLLQQIRLYNVLFAGGNTQHSTADIVNTQQLFLSTPGLIVKGIFCQIQQHHVGLVQRNIRLGEAPSHGKPVMLYDASASGATNYLLLAKEFLKKNRKKTTK
jgi:cellulose biosynthesis protein BcsQ